MRNLSVLWTYTLVTMAMEKETVGSATTGHDDTEDRRLVQRTLAGDLRAFTSIVESYTPVFHSLLTHMHPHRCNESIEDDLQEIFLRIFRALPRFALEKSFFSWAYTIAMNWSRSLWRTYGRRRRWRTVPYDDCMGTLEGSDPDPFDSVVASEAKQMLARGLSKLKPIQRDVFTLRMMEGLSVQDTAKVLGIPEGTVKTHLHRARALLRKWFASHHWNV